VTVLQRFWVGLEGNNTPRPSINDMARQTDPQLWRNMQRNPTCMWRCDRCACHSVWPALHIYPAGV